MRLIFLGTVFLFFFCQRPVVQENSEENNLQEEPVQEQIVPAANILEEYLPLLNGKRVALTVNQTSIVGNTHLVDTLITRNINVVKVFAPEHGFRGTADAGEAVKNSIDQQTGIPIVSLYGNNKKPSPEQLNDVDIIVFDIQDVGVRFYTYISTMHYLMEAAAENNKKIIILDRPNPHGMYIDGPILREQFKSFVGMHPIPLVHGLTVGELARMINEEGWLSGNLKSDLQVFKMKNYDHSKKYSLPVKPSPNLPNDLSIALYPSLGLFEGTVISVGRGTYAPFQQIGHPELEEYPHTFTPVGIEGMSKNPPYEGRQVHGISFKDEEPEYGFTLKYVIQMYQAFPEKDKFFNNFFEKLIGNAEVRKQIKAGMSEEDIRKTWQNDLNDFRQLRGKYLLYPEK